MTVTKHVHKLKRHYYSNGTPVYFCTLNCDYKISPALSLGKHTICWRCGKEFGMNQYSITLAKPHCEECHVFKGDGKKKVKSRRVNDEPLPAISSSIATEVTDSLKDKLSAISSGHTTEYRTLIIDENAEEEDML